MNYRYFEINYISCEGNERWNIAQCPEDWTEYDLECNIQLGGVGDDMAKIVSITPTNEPEDSIYTSYC
jgi:hypothetical protein